MTLSRENSTFSSATYQFLPAKWKCVRNGNGEEGTNRLKSEGMGRGMLVHGSINPSLDKEKRSFAESFVQVRREELIRDLVFPRAGERLLDVGCGTGEHLMFFRNQGCSVTGIDPSRERVEAAQRKLGHRADIHAGRAEDLPFSDNEFDIVTMIASLEFVEDPQKAVSEAVRVSRDRVFLGTWNRYAIMNPHGGHREFFCSSTGESPVQPLGGLQLVRLVRNLLPGVPIYWGSVLFFPLEWYTYLSGLERHIPMRKNPFGAFLGFSFSVQATYRTIQDLIREPLGANSKGSQALQGAAIGMKQEGVTGGHHPRKIDPEHEGLFPDLQREPGFLPHRGRPDLWHKGFQPSHK